MGETFADMEKFSQRPQTAIAHITVHLNRKLPTPGNGQPSQAAKDKALPCIRKNKEQHGTSNKRQVS